MNPADAKRTGPGGLWALLIVFAVVGASVLPSGDGAAPLVGDCPRIDRYGDPLPKGAVARLGTVRLRHEHGQSVESIAYLPDGRSLLSADSGSQDAGKGTRLYRWDAASGKLLRRLGNPESAIDHFALSTDGKTCLTSEYGRLYAWDVVTGRLLRKWREEESVLCPHILPGGKEIVGVRGGAVETRTVLDGERVRRVVLAASGQMIDEKDLAFSPDGKTLIQTDILLPKVVVWDVATGKVRKVLESSSSVAFSPDGKVFALGNSWAGTVQLRETATLRLVREWKACKPKAADGSRFPLAFSSDGRLLAVGIDWEAISLWNPATGRLVRRIEGKRLSVVALAFAPDGKRIASGGDNGVVRQWDVATGKETPSFAGHQERVTSVGYLSDGKIFSAGIDSTALFWDVKDAREIRRISSDEPAFEIAASADGKRVAFGEYNRNIRLVDASTGKVLFVLREDDHNWHLTFSSDGRTLAKLVRGKGVRLWDTRTGNRLRSVAGGQDLEAFALSPDGRTLALGEKHLAVYDVKTGVRAWQSAKTDGITSVCFSPDGKAIFSVCQIERGPRGWSAVGKPLWDLPEDFENSDWRAQSIACSPDGRWLAVGGNDDHKGGVRLYDAASGQEVGLFVGHGTDVESVAFSPDGHHVASGGDDHCVLVWDVTGLSPGERGGKRRLGPRRAEELAKALAGSDAKAAWLALGELVHSPDDSVRAIEKSLRPVKAIPPATLARWIARLDDDSFAAREQASKALAEAGDQAAPALRKAVAGGASAEMKNRAARLSKSYAGQRPYQTRALCVLEQIGSREAKAVLSRLAGGSADSSLTKEAAESLRRLRR